MLSKSPTSFYNYPLPKQVFLHMATRLFDNHVLYHRFLHHASNKKQIQDEMHSLTPEELQEAESNKFGSNQVILEETTQIIQDALDILKEDIQHICKKDSYGLVEMHCPDYYARRIDFCFMLFRFTKFHATQGISKNGEILILPSGIGRSGSCVMDFEEDEVDWLTFEVEEVFKLWKNQTILQTKVVLYCLGGLATLRGKRMFYLELQKMKNGQKKRKLSSISHVESTHGCPWLYRN